MSDIKISANDVAFLTLTTLRLVKILQSNGITVTPENLDDQIAQAEARISSLNERIFADRKKE